MAVRPVLVIVGIIVILMGAVWAVQGAGLLPTTFMTGPPWIAIGSGVAVAGLLVTVFGMRQPSPAKRV